MSDSDANKNLEQRVQQSIRARQIEGKSALRSMILRESAALLLVRGYEGFSLRQVAERIGYSATTIYRYFKNKDELIGDVIDQGFHIFATHVHGAVSSESDPMRRLHALNRAYVQFGLENPVYYRVMFVIRPDLLLEVPAERQLQWLSTFHSLVSTVEALVASGETPYTEVESLSRLLWAQVHGIVTLAISMSVYSPDEAVAAVDFLNQVMAPGLRGA